MKIFPYGDVKLENLYDKLPVDVLAQFYFHINENINKGILSKSMYYEIDLIKKSARKRGLSIDELIKHLEAN